MYAAVPLELIYYHAGCIPTADVCRQILKKRTLTYRAWGNHLWFRGRNVSFEIMDEPLEAWCEAMHPVWSRHLAARMFRRALRKRVGRGGGGGGGGGGQSKAGGGTAGVEAQAAAAAAAAAAPEEEGVATVRALDEVAAEAAAVVVEREADEEDARFGRSRKGVGVQGEILATFTYDKLSLYIM